MSVERPTFHESWHRIAPLKPRLRSAVQSYRHVFRGRIYHVLAEPASNQFFRVDETAYHFVALLDGQRSVADAWAIANQHLGDSAPTQGEVIQLLGQLYSSNLLHAEMPPDSEQMFERYRKRVRREVGSYLLNFLFARIPLIDPQRMLDKWVGLVGWIFTPIGFAIWLLIVGAGFYQLTGHWSELWRGASPEVFLEGQNLVLLYFTFAIIKAFHELGHAFSCVYFGKKTGIPTTVHTIGIMLMVLAPVPYVDASSSWMLRSKWQRAVVGAAGMYVELTIASLAAFIWTHTTDPLIQSIAYNAMVISSVSTVIFNANPLLRFDGYYILSDLLEIANLAQRSKQYLYFIVRRYIFGVRYAQSTTHGQLEPLWLTIYAIASSIYRVFVSVAILFYLLQTKVLFFLGVAMAIGAVVGWAIMPVGKFIHYLMTGGELERVRNRAIGVTAAFALIVFIVVGLIPWPDRDRAEGIVEPVRIAQVHMAADGFIDSSLASGTEVKGDGKGLPLLTASNRELEAERDDIDAQIKGAEAKRELARAKDTAAVQAYTEQLAALQQRRDRVEADLASLTIRAPFDGVWYSPKAEQLSGMFIAKGQPVGLIADPCSLIIRVTADQRFGPRVAESDTVEMRVKGRPDTYVTGSIRRILSAAHQDLPSPALSYAAGGTMTTSKDDRNGKKSAEPFTEIQIEPDAIGAKDLRIGQRIVVRFSMPPQPLIVQWYRAISQIIQQRFSIPT